MAFRSPRKVPLVLLPTPLHRLDRLSERFGVDLWIKRDDLTGFALGGNKGRKLEYMLADALDQGAQAMVTCGAAQSNFVRQLGAACAVYGLRCVAAVMELPFEDAPPAGDRLRLDGGNVTLDGLFGVEAHFSPNGTWEELYAQAEALAKSLESEGLSVYRVPIGGSSPLGAYAFLQAADELRHQAAEPFDWIVTASSSGSTHTGLAYGFAGTETKVLGVASDPEPEIAEDFASLAAGLSELLEEAPRLAASDFRLDFDHVGPGYGVPSEAGDAAIAYLARAEGILLDPIYSGKAFAALLDHLAGGTVQGRILFWHTGGTPTLFSR